MRFVTHQLLLVRQETARGELWSRSEFRLRQQLYGCDVLSPHAPYERLDSAWLVDTRLDSDTASVKTKGPRISSEGRCCTGQVFVPCGGSTQIRMLKAAHWDGSSLGRAQPAAPWRAVWQDQEHRTMEGNCRTMKGNPLPAGQPSLGNPALGEAAGSSAAAGIPKTAG